MYSSVSLWKYVYVSRAPSRTAHRIWIGWSGGGGGAYTCRQHKSTRPMRTQCYKYYCTAAAPWNACVAFALFLHTPRREFGVHSHVYAHTHATFKSACTNASCHFHSSNDEAHSVMAVPPSVTTTAEGKSLFRWDHPQHSIALTLCVMVRHPACLTVLVWYHGGLCLTFSFIDGGPSTSAA